MSDDLQVSVGSEEAAERLRQDFEELLARVNGDMMLVTMVPDDPLSVEAAITAAERAVEAHLRQFEGNAALQSMRGDIQLRFRHAIQAQATGNGSF